MKQSKLPFSPLPPAVMKKISRRFMFFGDKLNKIMPNLKSDLFQADLKVSPRYYIANSLAIALFFGILVLGTLLAVGLVLEIDLIFPAILLGLAFFGFMIFSTLYYPKILAKKRMRKLETQLVPALRHLTVEMKSGVTLFQSMVGISQGYAEVSEEFKKIISEINAGMKETEALSQAARRNPSFSFRRALWQISNALKAGSDVGDALSAIIDDLLQEQVTAIRQYGQQLNPWTMIYMVAAVIIPSLGITFLVIITSFTGGLLPTGIILPLIIFALIGFQIFFMNFVKSKRPAI